MMKPQRRTPHPRRAPQRRGASYVAAIALLTVAALATSDCRYPRTQVVVWVWSNMPSTGTDSLDALQIVATHSGTNYMIGPVPVTTGASVDAGMNVRVLYPSGNSVVTLYPDDNGAPYEFTVQVTPLHDDGNGALRSLFAYGAYEQTSAFTPGETTQIDVYLTVECAHTQCPAGQTCGLNGCQSIAQSATAFDGSFPASPDVPTRVASDATEGTPPMDASMDTSMDVSMDTARDVRPEVASDVFTCEGGTTDCSGACVNLQTDSSNCGACGRACSGGTSCHSGSCGCASGRTLCSGSCVNTNTDNYNCGTCGHVCGVSVGLTCQSGACQCPALDNWCTTHCANLQTSSSDCGSCGHACASGTSCSAGTCV